MAQIKSWTVSDELWAKVEPLVPAKQRQQGRQYRRKPGAGRKPMAAQVVFSAIVYVLRTGCQWKALPKEYGSASAVHQHFQNWQKAGFYSLASGEPRKPFRLKDPHVHRRYLL